ncbi:hypothetical protein glysoja_012845 [Glycine soja]|nr:hypothetical protein glysoja_012845 [Glycine soja]
MEEFCRILAGKGWSFYKTKKAPSSDQRHGGAFYGFLPEKVGAFTKPRKTLLPISAAAAPFTSSEGWT